MNIIVGDDVAKKYRKQLIESYHKECTSEKYSYALLIIAAIYFGGHIAYAMGVMK